MCPNIKNREIREKNKNRILIELFISGKPLKRKEIVNRTGIHEKTVSRCLNELKEEGMVIQVKKGYWALNEQNLILKPAIPLQFLIQQIKRKREEEKNCNDPNVLQTLIESHLQEIVNALSRDLMKSFLLTKKVPNIYEFSPRSVLEHPIVFLLLLKEIVAYLKQNRDIKKRVLAKTFQDPSFCFIP